MKKKILIAEDESAILTGLIDLLEAEGFHVFPARDGEGALRAYQTQKPDLILLDIMMPEKSGYDVCKEIRKKDPLTPILMLTAKGHEVDKVVGLELGADDYIVKPFGIKELLSRIHAALRRAQAGSFKKDDSPIVFGDVIINPKTLKGKKRKKEFHVTEREIHLLKLFLSREGEVIDRYTLLKEVWGISYEGTSRTLDQHIANLRKKIEADPAKPRYIITAHTVGYQFFSKPEPRE